MPETTQIDLTTDTSSSRTLARAGSVAVATEVPAAQASAASADATDQAALDALQAYIRATQPAVQAEFERYADIYSDMAMATEGARTLVFRCTFREQTDADRARGDIEAMVADLDATAKSAILPHLRAIGIEGPTVKWMYVNADGTTIATFDVR